ncbi:hypothetical protein DTO027I6_9605 [Penicillium roqueforti]|nr:hypothetical protein CBS147337_9785 [Penicillium roqueforti]KAI3185965.1 hypothetical protein DTO027I6_9605 [Penicillium roqueforti]
MLHSKEGQAAWATQTGYYQAIKYRFDVHEAVATASPYSVSVLAYAADFLYHQGFLCYRVKDQIRLLDVHNSGQTECVLNLSHVIPRIIETEANHSNVGEQITLLYISDGILVLLINKVNLHEALLVGFDLQPRPDQARQRPVYGQQSAWVLWGMHFKTVQRTEFSIERLADGELGKRVCFEIYQGHLYVVSIIDQQESSFYHWSCYAPDNENNQGNGRLWRREHREGPIHEMWADLSIQVDEEKGRPVILECRRQWLDGGSENHRTYYTTPLPTPDEALGMHLTEALIHESGLVDSDDEYSQSSEKRLARECHAEHDISDPLDQRFDFIPAHTRHNSYHLAATTYIDLVNDPKLQADGVRSQHCLRLRTKSRECSRAIDEWSVEHSDSPGVCLWPSEDAPSELLALLCPDSSTSFVRAVCDERSLIYSTSAEGLPPHHHMLILINFDPMIRFPYLTSLRKQKASTTSTRKVLDAPRPDLHWSHAPVQNTEAFHLAIHYGYRP